MSQEQGTKMQPSRIEVVAAVVLGVAALGAFVLQALSVSERTTVTETALFNTLQFLLTVGFGWFSTRAVSRQEFEDSIKRFAVGAYRRVSDIEKMISRLQAQLRRMVIEARPDARAQLDVVSAVVDDAIQVVHSSIADWGDVIGQELLTLEELKRLEREKSEIKSESSGAVRRDALRQVQADLEKRIADLRASLPARLQLQSEVEDADWRAVTGAEWLARRHQAEGGVILSAYNGPGYPNASDPRAFTSQTKLRTKVTANGPLDIADASGELVGRVLIGLCITNRKAASSVVFCGHETTWEPGGVGEAAAASNRALGERAHAVGGGTKSWRSGQRGVAVAGDVSPQGGARPGR